MRKTLLTIIATVLTVATVNAQIYHEECKEDLREFMRQETNFEKLGLTVADTLSWYDNEDWVGKVEGISWIGTEGRIERISWRSRELEGKLELSSPVLTRFFCNNNNLSELDVSKNTQLWWLECHNNNLTKLDVGSNTLLQNFFCNNNNLSELDVSNNTLLRLLYCHNNNLTKLDVSSNTLLQNFICNNNNLSELDVSNNTLLRGLYCHNNNLSELDVSNNTLLQEFVCHNNNLSELDVSNNTQLETFHCDSNNLSELDVSKNTLLRHLECHNNNLTKLDVSNNTLLRLLYCHNNNLSELDVSDLWYLYCHNNKFKFSTLPILNLAYGRYRYSPQDTIDGGIKSYSDTVDLSSEYNVNENITTYEWFDITDDEEKEITQPTNENGVFTFTEQHIDKKLRCKMNNAQFPDLTLVYEVEIKLVNIEEPNEISFTVLPNPAQDKLTIHHSKEIGNISLYDLSGRLLRSFTVDETNTVLDISDLDIGIYFITVDGKTVKFIKE